jgi:hypothetical protein
MPEKFNPDLFVAKWYCSKVGPEDMPRFAADALEADFDGPALRRLAGLMRPTSSDVGDLFEQALREIGTVTVQSKQQAMVFESRQIVLGIVEGRIEPVYAADILATYAMKLEYPDFLVGFFQLADLPRWGEYAPSRQKLTEDIIAEAHLFLASVPG